MVCQSNLGQQLTELLGKKTRDELSGALQLQHPPLPHGPTWPAGLACRHCTEDFQSRLSSMATARDPSPKN